MNEMSFVDDFADTSITPTVTESITNLEDPRLTKHIDELRDLFLKYRVSLNTNPLEVINNDKNIRVMLSEIIIEIRQHYSDIRHISDLLSIHTINTKQLAEGNKPYSYQECKTASEIFNKMSNVLNENAKKAEEVSYGIEEIEHKLVKMRRLYESILGNITQTTL